jgi:PAS domain S-box-containing protein
MNGGSVNLGTDSPPPRDAAVIDYHALFQNAPDAILIADDQGRYVDANLAACELFGVSLQDLVGKRVMDFVRPEDLETTRQQWGRFRSERSQTGRFPLRRPDGQTRMLEYSALADVAPGLHISILRDVTGYASGPVGWRTRAVEGGRERRRWTAAFTRALDWEVHTTAGRYAVTVALIGLATGIQWLAWPVVKPLAYFLYYPAVTVATLYGVPWLAIVLSVLLAQFFFVPPTYSLEVANWGELARTAVFAFNALLISGIGLALRDSRRKAHDALRRQEEAFVQAERTIASLTKAESALKESELLLREQSTLREQFVAGLSHDLRTPLSTAKLAAVMAARNAQDVERVRVNAARIVRSVDNADQLIRDLLDANRVRAGQKLPIDPVQCELVALIRAALDDLAAVHGNRFVLRAPPALPGEWDPNAIRRVLENLAGNAVKYGAANAAIEVTLAEADGWVELSVTNQGNPVPPEELDRLFIPYHRGAGAQASGRGGWGIGLMLVKGVVEAHGGSVSVASSPESGTTFTLRLPRQHAR